VVIEILLDVVVSLFETRTADYHICASILGPTGWKESNDEKSCERKEMTFSAFA
jgi:hypothetical protein